MLGKFLVFTAIASATALVAIVNFTTPTSAGAIGVLGVFIVAYMLVLSVLTFLLFWISSFLSKAEGYFAPKRPTVPLTLKRSYYYASVVALGPVIIISLQSVGSVGVYELGLVLVLIAVGCLYVTKRTE